MNGLGKHILFLLFAALTRVTGAQNVHPNIVFIYTDDQRYDALGINGNEVILTPAIDKLASEGVRFSNANVVFSLCSPSRAALLTGRYGSANGVLQLGSDLNKDEFTVAQLLKEKGYTTGISGKWHIGRTPVDAGFDFGVWFEGNGTYYDRTIFDEGKKINPEMHCDLYCVKRSIGFLKEAAAKKQPFFLFQNPQTPHMNGNHIWDARVETTKKYNKADMPVAQNRLDDLTNKPDYLKESRNLSQAKLYGYPDSAAIQQHTLEYYSVITELDGFLKLLFDELERLDLMDNTYIFFMSDNGWMLGEHGFTSKVLPYQPSVSVPFFVVGPGIQPSVSDELVLNIDVAPTLLALAGIKIPDNMHGKSLMPLLIGENAGWRQEFVYEGLGTYGNARPNLTLVNKQHRYIQTYSDEKLDNLVFEELYDRNHDKDEQINIAGSPQLQEQVSSYKNKIAVHKKTIINK